MADNEARRSAGLRAAQRLRGRALAFSVAVACLAATGFAFLAVSSAEQDREQGRFERDAERVELAIRARLAEEATSLRAAAGLFAASHSVERAEWREYVGQQAVEHSHRGVEALCYVARVSRGRFDAWLAETRGDDADEFAVVDEPAGGASPADPPRPGATDDYAIFKYVEPQMKHAKLAGLRLASGSPFRVALEAAKDRYSPLLSPAVPRRAAPQEPWSTALILPVTSNGPPRPGGDGRELNVGWVVALIDTHGLLRDDIAHMAPGVDVAAYDGESVDPARLLFDFDSELPGADAPVVTEPHQHEKTTTTAVLGDHAWTLRTWNLASWAGAENAKLRWFVLALGVAVSALVGLTIAALTRTRRLAERLAERATTHLERQADALKQARDEAMAATRAKSQVLAAVSHEIRTPIHGVLGMTQLLLDGELSVEQAEQARTIETSARALLAILNDLLDVSKIEAGKLSLELAPFDVRAQFEDVLDVLVPAAADKGVELVLRVARGTPPKWIGDALRLKQVLTNFASNAVKFTDRGHVVVHVSASDVQERVATLEVRVEDTGIGIAPEDVGRLFRRFSQVDASTSRRHGGTGLGLLICRLLVERMGGTVAVESRVGEGSTFRFSLPLGIPHDESAFPALEKLSGPVLVIDDSEPARASAREMLEGLGCEVLEAASGPAGVAVAREAAVAGRPVAAALVDLALDADDGFAVARAFRGDPSTAAIPLVLTAPPTHAILAEQARAAEFDAWLTKPLRRRDVRDALSRLRGGRPIDGRFLTRAVLAAGRRGLGSSSPGLPVPPPASRHVLLAEDNDVNVRVARRMLERLGCTVDVATGGKEAIEKALGGAYDLVFMDVRMPEVDGYDATAAIRAREDAGSRTPIVAMTADTTEVDRQKCLDAGMDDFLGKPVSIDTLRRTLSRWCGPAPSDSNPGI